MMKVVMKILNHLNGVKLLDYNNIDELEDYLKKTPNVVSVMLEPIQGEGE